MDALSMLKINTEDNIIKVPYPIPFYTQMVDFNDETLQGFNTVEEAEYWQERGCGIASIKMIIYKTLKIYILIYLHNNLFIGNLI